MIMQYAGSTVDATDYQLPSMVTAYANGSNSITALLGAATSPADLPTIPCSASITNPHPIADMLIMCVFGAWLQGNSTFVRIYPNITGALAQVPHTPGGDQGWGAWPGRGGTTIGRHGAEAPYNLPPGTTTFTLQAMRDSVSFTPTVQFATIRLVPLRYAMPKGS
jgi:hypothetical protein